jgi:uncharacterized protein YydD (DUF2326 family)
MTNGTFEREMRAFMQEMRDGMRLGFASLQLDLGTVLAKQDEHSATLAEHSAILKDHSVQIRVLQQDVRELRGELMRRRPGED